MLDYAINNSKYVMHSMYLENTGHWTVETNKQKKINLIYLFVIKFQFAVFFLFLFVLFAFALVVVVVC